MASKRAPTALNQLSTAIKPQRHRRCLLQSRTMATLTNEPSPGATLSEVRLETHLDSTPTEPILNDTATAPPPPSRQPPIQIAKPYVPPPNPFLSTTTCTLHSFPKLAPESYATYPSTHLLLPMRKDILHRAVIYEGDATRQGTANTKWRSEVHGSNKKVRPQKGTGHARLGDKKSPMLKGGGVAFGPKPRDFSTELPRKVYDLAWRTALSYRYRMGQLVVLQEKADLEDVEKSIRERFLRKVLDTHQMGQRRGRTLFITMEENEALYETLQGEHMERVAVARQVEDVDVKNLLSLGRIVMEKRALNWILRNHQSDLPPSQQLAAWSRTKLRGRSGAPSVQALA